MPESQMLINYVPGEECRVAVVEDGKLEELYVERFATASRVGNIYVGKVVNVEPAIQAAFVDFGVGENGFLHVTDLHPRYFPGEDGETTERVGFKTPRRERPPIQHALRRGDEVIVQVLKEGVGTKGPTVTSYLSIPGRFLVMMPQMDRVGVSRKVEDEEQRRQMREILDQLELPEGFGFILRTAGLSRTKAELKRDLAYLQRLWKDMDRRLKTGGKPRLLYSESDLLVRSLRDMLTNDIGQIIIDNEVALRRASRFMKIVAPRGTTRLLHTPDKTPIFHAFGIEKQIALIHAREVPLPSGGRLVIDQTEALVAIDVNSGKSRESRDAETNAYQTNIEAVDEICRQLRLRDMGGIVINDLIDMRHASHRKDIENRFKERLKRDRAKSTVLPISEFGIVEMTRQRMRASHESVHFTDCPTCRGRGVLQRPDSVAADALREMAAILDSEKVSKVEMVVAPRVASELLSTKRQLLSRTERLYGKHVDVRVSETVPVDRISFYAYDPAGADIDPANLPLPRKPKELREWEEPGAKDAEWAMNPEEEQAALPEPDIDEVQDEADLHPIELEDEPEQPAEPQEAGERTEEGGRRKRRRRGRGRAGDRTGEPKQQQPPQQQQRRPAPARPAPVDRPQVALAGAEADGEHRPDDQGAPPADRPQGDQGAQELGPDGEPRKRRRRRRRGRGRGRGGEGAPQDVASQNGEQHAPPVDRVAPPASVVDSDWGDEPAPRPISPEPVAEAPGEDREPAPIEDTGESQEPPTGDNQPQGGDEPRQGGRRRRRRRGRGGRGGGGGQGGQGDGGQENGQGSEGQRPKERPPQQGQPQQRRPQPPRAQQPQVQNQSRPQPTAAAPSPAGAAPKPRSLYGTSRRKLMPSELNRRPKPE